MPELLLRPDPTPVPLLPIEPPKELLLLAAGRLGALVERLALARGALLGRLALFALLRALVRLLPALRLLAFFLGEAARDERALELRRELATFLFELDDLRAAVLRPRDEDERDLLPFFRVAISTPFVTRLRESMRTMQEPFPEILGPQ